MTTQHINTRYGFGGGFFGDYTDMSASSDNVSHALWTDSKQRAERGVVLRTPVRTDADPPAGRRHGRGPLVFDDRADSNVGPVFIVESRNLAGEGFPKACRLFG